MGTTQNVNDFLFRQGANGDDPVLRYAFVGKTLEEGIFAWIRFGVDTNQNRRINPAAFWTANGGVMNPTGPVRPGGGVGAGGGFPGWGGRKREAEEGAEQEEA